MNTKCHFQSIFTTLGKTSFLVLSVLQSVVCVHLPSHTGKISRGVLTLCQQRLYMVIDIKEEAYSPITEITEGNRLSFLWPDIKLLLSNWY